MQWNNKTYDAAVIGAGLSGLTAAVYLAKAGLSVLVIDKTNHIGGRAMTIRKERAYLNLGVHGFYQGGAGEEVLRELGIQLKGANPPASAAAVWNQTIYPLPNGLLPLLQSRLFSWQGKWELAKLMMKLSSLDPKAMEHISFREWAEREIREPMVRHVIYAISRANTYVPYPELLLAGPAVQQLQRTFSAKVFYPDYGWGAIADALKQQALLSGADFLLGHRVFRIERIGEGFGLQLSNGIQTSASFVITTGSPKETCELVTDSERTQLAVWRDQARPIHAACLDLVLRRLPNPEFSLIAGFFTDVPLFYNNPSAVAKCSDDGSVVIHLIKHLGGSKGDASTDERQMEQAMNLLHPGWRKEEITRQFLPCMTVAHDFNSTDRSGSRRGPSVPEIEGLYVAGDWTRSDDVLADASFASAKEAAMAVIQQHAKQRAGGMDGNRTMV